MNTTGNSDPGRNGLLSPWGKIKGLYFDDSMETGNFFWNLQHDLQEYYASKGKIYIITNNISQIPGDTATTICFPDER